MVQGAGPAPERLGNAVPQALDPGRKAPGRPSLRAWDSADVPAGADSAYSKIPAGKYAATTQFGASTISLIFRPTATLHSA